MAYLSPPDKILFFFHVTSNGDAAKDLRTNNVHHQVLQYSKSDATRSWPSISRAECLVSRWPCILLFPDSRSRYGEERSSMYLHLQLVPLPKPGYGTSICPGSSLFFSGPDLASSSPPIGTDFSAPLYFFPGARQSGSPFLLCLFEKAKGLN